MVDLARCGRSVEQSYCAGSVPPDLQTVWDRLRDEGVEVELLERPTGIEEGVDERLQARMRQTLESSMMPGIAVLLTGDGAGYEGGTGFRVELEQMYNLGWGIEVLSWSAACNHNLRDWATEVGAFVSLEDYFESVTFIHGGRKPKPLNMKRRKTAKPRR